MVLLAGCGEMWAASHALRAVRTWSLGDTTRIAIETDGVVEYRHDQLPEPPRIYFDLEDTGVGPLRGPAATITVGDPVVKQIRVALTQRDRTRVVLDLFERGEYTVSYLTNPARIVVEVKRAGAPAPTVAPAPVLPAIPAVTAERPGKAGLKPAPMPARKAVKPGPPVWELARHPAVRAPRPRLASIAAPKTWSRPVAYPPAAAAAASAAKREAVEAPRVTVAAKVAPAAVAEVIEPLEPGAPAPEPKTASMARNADRSLTRALGLKLRRVVLDAGHGGHDTGTISRTGLKEKDLVLDVTKRLGRLIEERMGSEVVYTREDDTFIPLEERTAFANRQKADLFLSIHANSSPTRVAAGIETYYLNFTTSRADLEVAARENASSEKSIHDLPDLVRKITLQDKVDESREFAARVQAAGHELTVQSQGRLRNRGVKKAPFVVLIGAKMPSVLVEIGFLTNSREEALMKKPEYRQKLAEALFKGVSQYANSLSHFRVAQTTGGRGLTAADQ